MIDLFDLDDMIPGLGIDPSDEHLELLFQSFEKDFINEPFYIDGIQVRIDIRNSREEGFENFPHTFVKMLTRGPKNRRIFDRKRANKVHWIKPILENRYTDDITHFKFKEGNGSIRDYFWFREGDFLVIMELITPDYMMISCFHIDDDTNRNYYERKYKNRE